MTNDNVDKLLAHLNADAARGKISALALVYVDPDGDIVALYAPNDAALQLAHGMAVARTAMIGIARGVDATVVDVPDDESPADDDGDPEPDPEPPPGELN